MRGPNRMNRSRLGLKALGLCALVAGLMAIAGANVAQAEVGAAWNWENPVTHVKGTFSTTLEAEVKVEVEPAAPGALLVEGLPEVVCTTGALTEGGKLTTNGSITSGRVLFSNCLSYVNGSALKTRLPSCDPIGGDVTTEKGHGLIKLHVLTNGDKDDTVLFLPDTGEVLAVLHLNEECATGEEIIVKGELVIWDCKGNLVSLTLGTSHLIEEFPGLHLMHVGVKTATLDGSA